MVTDLTNLQLTSGGTGNGSADNFFRGKQLKCDLNVKFES